MSFYFPDQAYPGDDPYEVGRQMGLTPDEIDALLAGEQPGPPGLDMGGGGASTIDPNMLAEIVGQQYNPYQGYPTKQVSDQVWDVYGPTPDYLVAQLFGQLNPNLDQFSTDAFYGADPMIRGPLAEGLAEGGGDPIAAYDYLQSGDFQDRLRDDIGRTEWDALRQRGDLASIGAIGGEELDQAGIDFYNRNLEQALAQGSPSFQGNLADFDYFAERQGGRPYPGAGTMPGEGGQSEYQASLAELAGPDIDYSATPEALDPLANLQAVGATPEDRPGDFMAEFLGAGPNRVSYEDGERFADIDGVRYQMDPNAADPLTGQNPYYLEQLRAVLANRRSRLREMNPVERAEPSRRGGAGGLIDNQGTRAQAENLRQGGSAGGAHRFLTSLLDRIGTSESTRDNRRAVLDRQREAILRARR